MAQDRREGPSIITRLGLNPKAVELERSKTPLSRRRSMFRRVPVDINSYRSPSKTPSKIAPVAPVAPSVVGTGSVGYVAHSPARHKRLGARIGRGSGSGSARKDEAQGKLAPAPAPACINDQFRVSKAILPKPITPKTASKSPMRVYGKQRPALTPVPAPKYHDIYELEDDWSVLKTSVSLPTARKEQHSSEDIDSEDLQQSSAPENIFTQEPSSRPVEDERISQESLNLVEQLVLQRKSQKQQLSPVNVTPLIANQEFYSEASGQSAQVSGQQERNTSLKTTHIEGANHRTRKPIHNVPTPSHHGEVVKEKQEDDPCPAMAHQERLDDLDLEILRLLDDNERSETSYAIQKRARATPDANHRPKRVFNLVEYEGEEEKNEATLPASKKRCADQKHSKNGSETSRVFDIGNIGIKRPKKKNNYKGSSNKKREKPRGLPVKELKMTCEKMTTSDLDENPAELSEDSVSQSRGNELPRKMFDIKLNFPSRNRFGHIEISHFRVPEPQRLHDGVRKSSFKDGFEGDEAKPTKMYMPIKKSSRRKEAFDKFVIRMPKLTIVAEKPCSSDEEADASPRCRVKKKKRQPHAEQNNNPSMALFHPNVEQESDAMIQENQYMQQKLRDAKPRQVYRDGEMIGSQNLTSGWPQVVSRVASQCPPVRTPRPVPSPKGMPKTPVSKDSPIDRKQVCRQNNLFVEADDANNDPGSHTYRESPSSLHISAGDSGSQKIEQKISTRKKTVKAKKDSIQVSQELSLVYVTRRFKDIDDSDSESDGETFRESDTSSVSDESGEGVYEEEQEKYESEESHVEDGRALEPIDHSDSGLEELVMVSPERSIKIRCEAVNIGAISHSSASVKVDFNPDPIQENTTMTDDEKGLVVEEKQLDVQDPEKNHTPMEDQDLSFNDDDEGDPYGSQETQDDEITATQLHDLPREIEELALTQEIPVSLLPQQSLAERKADVLSPLHNVNSDQALELRGMAIAAGTSLFSPQNEVHPHRQHVPFAAGTKILVSSVTQQKRESQQSYVDGQSMWKPQIPKVVDMSFEAGNDIVDNFGSPTPLSSQVRALGQRQRMTRCRSMIPMRSMAISSSQLLNLVMESEQLDLVPSAARSEPRHSQAAFIPSKQSSAIEESHTKSFQHSQTIPEDQSQSDLEIPETQSIITPGSSYFTVAEQRLSRSFFSSASKSSSPWSRTKSSPANVLYPRLSRHSELAMIPSVEVFKNAILSTPQTVPTSQQAHSIKITPSQQSLSAITRRASQNLGSRSGTPMSFAIRGRIPSLLKHPPKKQ